MTSVVVTLFDHPDKANEAMLALEKAGFTRANMESVESDPESQSFFKRLFTTDGGEKLAAKQTMEYLTRMGIPDEEANAYADQVRKGNSLLIVRCSDDQQAQRATELLRQYPFEEAELERQDLPKAEPPEARSERDIQGPEEEVAVGKQKIETGEEQFEEFDTSAEELQAGAATGTHAGEVEDVLAPQEVDVDEFGAQAQPRFEQFEPDIRRHYDENLATTGYRFSDFARGYRYGMALAESSDYRGHDWQNIEPIASRHWEARSEDIGPWERFKESVRYGWHKIRGDEESLQTPPGRA